MGSLFFLIALLAIVVVLNWRFLAASFGLKTKPCDWSRNHTRDRGDQKAWFCPSCRREEFTRGKDPPADCGRPR